MLSILLSEKEILALLQKEIRNSLCSPYFTKDEVSLFENKMIELSSAFPSEYSSDFLFVRFFDINSSSSNEAFNLLKELFNISETSFYHLNKHQVPKFASNVDFIALGIFNRLFSKKIVLFCY